MWKAFFLLAIGLITTVVHAQEPVGNTVTREGRPPGGRSIVTLHSDFVPEDLDSLVTYSPLIVRGKIEMQLPARCAGEDCLFLYTDFEFTVSQLLKDDGTKRKFDKVIVSQDGGK